MENSSLNNEPISEQELIPSAEANESGQSRNNEEYPKKGHELIAGQGLGDETSSQDEGLDDNNADKSELPLTKQNSINDLYSTKSLLYSTAAKHALTNNTEYLMPESFASDSVINFRGIESDTYSDVVDTIEEEQMYSTMLDEVEISNDLYQQTSSEKTNDFVSQYDGVSNNEVGNFYSNNIEPTTTSNFHGVSEVVTEESDSAIIENIFHGTEIDQAPQIMENLTSIHVESGNENLSENVEENLSAENGFHGTTFQNRIDDSIEENFQGSTKPAQETDKIQDQLSSHADKISTDHLLAIQESYSTEGATSNNEYTENEQSIMIRNYSSIKVPESEQSATNLNTETYWRTREGEMGMAMLTWNDFDRINLTSSEEPLDMGTISVSGGDLWARAKETNDRSTFLVNETVQRTEGFEDLLGDEDESKDSISFSINDDFGTEELTATRHTEVFSGPETSEQILLNMPTLGEGVGGYSSNRNESLKTNKSTAIKEEIIFGHLGEINDIADSGVVEKRRDLSSTSVNSIQNDTLANTSNNVSEDNSFVPETSSWPKAEEISSTLLSGTHFNKNESGTQSQDKGFFEAKFHREIREITPEEVYDAISRTDEASRIKMAEHFIGTQKEEKNVLNSSKDNLTTLNNITAVNSEFTPEQKSTNQTGLSTYQLSEPNATNNTVVGGGILNNSIESVESTTKSGKGNLNETFITMGASIGETTLSAKLLQLSSESMIAFKIQKQVNRSSATNQNLSEIFLQPTDNESVQLPVEHPVFEHATSLILKSTSTNLTTVAEQDDKQRFALISRKRKSAGAMSNISTHDNGLPVSTLNL
ncbi:hypothetical protein ACOME3_005041 [Neoechinorhynchus agilis]